jgi:catechol 2,3-dioxygenase-like lactoylglutathione lyase family enzyme
MPRLSRILETALYVDDMDRARHFYGTVLGLEPIFEAETLVAFSVGGQSVLLIFLRGGSMKTQHFPRGIGAPQGEIPPHDGHGPLHICFAIDADELPAWEAKLAEGGIPIEGRMQWVRGGKSIYFRDPDNHLLELMTPGNWSIY